MESQMGDGSHKPSKYGCFISAFKKHQLDPGGLHHLPICLTSGAFLSLPPFLASRNMSNDAPKNAGAQRPQGPRGGGVPALHLEIQVTALRKAGLNFSRGI